MRISSSPTTNSTHSNHFWQGFTTGLQATGWRGWVLRDLESVHVIMFV